MNVHEASTPQAQHVLTTRLPGPGAHARVLACALLTACRAAGPPATPATLATPATPSTPATPATPARTTDSAAPAAVPTNAPPPEAGVLGTSGHFVAASSEHPGSRGPDVVRRVVRAHIKDIRVCYNRGLERDPSLAGRVAIQFTIGPEGTVKSSVVQSSTLSVADRSTADCIAAAALQWRFPEPEGGGSVIISYPFVLETGDVPPPPSAPPK